MEVIKYQNILKIREIRLCLPQMAVDEMMGGYELYKKIKWLVGKNCSPYSHVSINGKLKKENR